MNKNPIFVEYYSHTSCDCFKVKNPFTGYASDKLVLCPISEGIEKAKKLAAEVLTQELTDALDQPLETPKRIFDLTSFLIYDRLFT